jgi:hypothetical protein
VKLKFGSLASLLPRMKSMTVPPMLWAITQKVPPCAYVWRSGCRRRRHRRWSR